MAVPTRESRQDPVEVEPAEAMVTAHRTTPQRFVFTESENHDGWISTDLTVELQR